MARFWDADKRIAIGLFVLISSIYFATMIGITSSNDGSHYALVRALVDRRSFEISPYMEFTENQDYALHGDLRFSDRPPGTALLAAPLYALSSFAPSPLVQPPSRHDPENPRMLYAVLISPLAAAAAVSLFFMILRRIFVRSQYSALLTSIAFALGTTQWKYGSILYSHAVASLVLLGTVYLILRSWDKPLRWQGALLLGFLLGFAPLVEYTNVIASAILALGWLIGNRSFRSPLHDPAERLNFAMVAVGALIPIIFLMVYNTVNFGGPFELSTFNVDTKLWPQNAGMAQNFATPLLFGLQAMLVYGADNQGMFVLSPIALSGLLGLWSFVRFAPRRAFFILSLFAIMLLIFAKSTTFNPLTNDGRYLTPFIGLWFIPVAFWLDSVCAARRNETVAVFLGLLVFGLLFLSIRNQMVHIAFSWNYDFDVTRLRAMSIAPENVGYFLKTVFPNAANLPLLWLAEGIVLGIAVLVGEWQGRRRDSEIAALSDTGVL